MSLEDLARQHGAPDEAGIQRHQGEILRNAGNPPKCEPKLFGCSGGGFSTIYPQPGVQIRIQSANPNRHLRGNLKRFSPYPLEAPLTPSAPSQYPFLLGWFAKTRDQGLPSSPNNVSISSSRVDPIGSLKGEPIAFTKMHPKITVV